MKKSFFNDQWPEKVTTWLGTPVSILVHTIFFILMFALVLFGWQLEEMLLVLTTIVSLEAIYLALFIQMSVNKTSSDLEDVEKDIDIIQLDERKDDIYTAKIAKTLVEIEDRLAVISSDVESLKRKGRSKRRGK